MHTGKITVQGIFPICPPLVTGGETRRSLVTRQESCIQPAAPGRTSVQIILPGFHQPRLAAKTFCTYFSPSSPFIIISPLSIIQNSTENRLACQSLFCPGGYSVPRSWEGYWLTFLFYFPSGQAGGRLAAHYYGNITE